MQDCIVYIIYVHLLKVGYKPFFYVFSIFIYFVVTAVQSHNVNCNLPVLYAICNIILIKLLGTIINKAIATLKSLHVFPFIAVLIWYFIHVYQITQHVIKLLIFVKLFLSSCWSASQRLIIYELLS